MAPKYRPAAGDFGQCFCKRKILIGYFFAISTVLSEEYESTRMISKLLKPSKAASTDSIHLAILASSSFAGITTDINFSKISDNGLDKIIEIASFYKASVYRENHLEVSLMNQTCEVYLDIFLNYNYIISHHDYQNPSAKRKKYL